MLRDGWNFHNDVAMVIENKSRSCFGFTYGDYNMFSADEVECGTFAECMMLMLRKKSKYCKSNDEIEAFIEKYKRLYWKKWTRNCCRDSTTYDRRIRENL